MGYKIQFENGKVVEFESQPSPADIDHVWKSMAIKPEPSYMSRVGQAGEALGRTALGMVGAIPQGIRGIGEAITGGLEGAWDRSESSNPANMIPEATGEVPQFQEHIGHGLDKLQQAGGKIVQMPFEFTGLAGVPEYEQKRMLANAKTPESRSELEKVFAGQDTTAEALGNFLPIPAVKGKGFKFKEKETPSSVISKLEELAKQKTEAPTWKSESTTDLPKIDESLILRGTEREQPLPKIYDPEVLEAAKLKGTPEPLRDPLMEMPPHENFPKDTSLQGPAPRTPDLSTELGAQARPNVPDTVAMATNHTMPTIEFPLRAEHLQTPDPQMLLREHDQRSWEQRRNRSEIDALDKAGIEIPTDKAIENIRTTNRVNELGQELKDHGWTGYETGKKPGLFEGGRGKTLAPIEKVKGLSGFGNKQKGYSGYGVSQAIADGLVKAVGTGMKAMKVFRASLDGARIKPGDWVTPSKDIAENVYNKHGQAKVLQDALPARDLVEVHPGGWVYAPKGTDLSNVMRHVDSQGNKVTLGQLAVAKGSKGSVPNVGESPLLKGLFKGFEKKPEVEATKHESNVSAVEATKALPGVGKVYNGIDIPPKDPKSFLEYAKDWIESGKDLTNFENWNAQVVKSGANLLAKEKRNPLIRHAYENIDSATKQAANLIENHVKPLTEQALQFDKKQLAEVHQALQLAEGKFEWSVADLKESGMNQKQIDFLTNFREAMNKALESENSARVARGEKPIPARTGYMAGRFLGDYRTLIKNAEGDVVYVVSENYKLLHNSALKALKKEFPESKFKYEELPYQKGSSRTGESVDAGYQAFMRNLVTDDPRAAAIESVYKDWKQKTSAFYLGQHQHFKQKSVEGVGGAQGLKLTKSLEANAVDSLKAQIRYMETAFMWSEMQKAAKNILDVTKDESLSAKMPNSIDYTREYLYNALGQRVNPLGKISEAVEAALSPIMGKGAIQDISGWTRAALNTKLLGGPLNAGFLLPNIIQVVNSLPEASSIGARLGNKNTTVTGSMMNGAINIVRRGNEYWKEAAKYASEQHVAKSAIDIDTKDIGTVHGLRTVDKVWNGPRRAVEESTRMTVFGGFVQIFKDSGYSKAESFKMAADATERSMADYRTFETPMAYSSGGFLGQSAIFLQKYLFNFLNQESGFLSNKEFKAASGLMAINLVTAGMAGLIGVQTYSAIAALWNDQFYEKTGIRIPNLKELLIKHKVPDWVTYGPASTVLGADLSSRMGMANMVPSSPTEAIFPGMSEIGSTASGVKDLFGSEWRTGLHKLNPTSTKWITEQAFFSKDGRPGKQIPINPTTKEPVGTMSKNPETGRMEPWQRDKEDQVWRGLGFRSLNEAKDRDKSYLVTQENLAVAKVEKDIIKAFGNKSYWAKNAFERSAAAKNAAELIKNSGGNPDTIVSKIESELIKQATTPEQRILLSKDMAKIKRYMAYGN